MMTVRADPVAVMLRGYKPGIDISGPLSEMEEDYEWMCLALLLDDGSARITGLDNTAPTPGQVREIRSILIKNYGVKKASWRHKHRKTIAT